MRFAGLPNIIHAKVVTTHLDRAEVSLFEEYFRENIDIFLLKNVGRPYKTSHKVV